jgi:hypothetical protein
VLWDGAEWSEVGTFDGRIRAIAVDEGGRVVVGGDFTRVGADQPASHVALWDGRGWRPLGSGVDGEVRALAFDEDGSLLVGGRFGSAGGLPAGSVARWDGAGWAPLGEGLAGSYGPASVSAIVVRDGEVLVGGDFVSSDGRPMENVARFDGTSWQPVGEGLPGLFVQDLELVGDVLVAAGHFDIGEDEHTVAAFRTDAWEPFEGDTDDLVESIASRPEGLYFAGPFVNAADHPSVGIALFRYAEAE